MPDYLFIARELNDFRGDVVADDWRVIIVPGDFTVVVGGTFHRCHIAENDRQLAASNIIQMPWAQ